MIKILQVYAIAFFTLISIDLFSISGKYRLILIDDPATTMCIGWDQMSGSNPIVYYGEIDGGTDPSKYPYMIKAQRAVQYKSMRNHFAQLTQLKPNTRYYFIIKDSEGSSSRYYFETLPNYRNAKLSVVAGGDSRRTRSGDNTSWEPRVNSNIMVSKLRPHVVVFGGDFTNLDTDEQWISWFNDWQFTISSDGRMTPLIPARGNHEQSNEVIINLFNVQAQNVAYALNLGGDLVRLYTLNSLGPIENSPQTQWLIQDLQENRGKQVWRMAQYHYPMNPHQSTKKKKVRQYNNWAMPFYKYRVQMVVECDAHVVKMTYPLRPDDNGDSGFVIDDKNGTTYIGEGSWGLTRTNDVSYDWTRSSGSFCQFKWMVISKDMMRLRTVKTANAKSIESVKETDRFRIPNGMDLWLIDGKMETLFTP